MIIGLIGHKQAGKDETAKILMKYYNFKRYAFADPIKEICKTVFMWDYDTLNDPILKEKIDEKWGISPRQILQVLGTELFQYEIGRYLPEFQKKIGRQIWVKRFEYWYKQNNEHDIVISDVRFPHEYSILKELGAYLIKINREAGFRDLHASEIELEQILFDYEIDNNKSLKDLEKTVIDLMEYKIHVRN